MKRKILISCLLAMMTLSSLAASDVFDKLSFYGMAQYRYRMVGTSISYTNETLTNEKSSDGYNRIAYMFGLKANPTETLKLQFQLGNDCVTTEGVDFYTINHISARSSFTPYFHIASFDWTVGPVVLSGGKLSQPGMAPLDLIERSSVNKYATSKLYTGAAGYDDAAQVTWSVGANKSIVGFKVTAPIDLSEDMKFAPSLLHSSWDLRTQSAAVDPKLMKNENLFLLDLPLTVNSMLKINPMAALVLNRFYNDYTEKGDHEISVGGKVSIKPTEGIDISLSGAFATINNENSFESSSDTYVTTDGTSSTTHYYATTDVTDFNTNVSWQGVFIGITSAIKAGPGTIKAGYNFSTSVDKESGDDAKVYHYLDFIYALKFKKYMSLMPRLRFYIDNKISSTTVMYIPEMIFSASF